MYYFALIAGTVLLYYILPKRVRWTALLLGNLIFYSFCGKKEFAILLFTAAAVYLAGRRIGVLSGELKAQKDHAAELRRALKSAPEEEKEEIKREQDLQKAEEKAQRASLKKVLIAGIAVPVAILVITKYTNFLLGLGGRIVLGERPAALRLIVPLGISFYTFQMIAYLMDVYRGRIPALTNPAKFFLYVSFFPTITQGPIARYEQLGEQLMAGNAYRFENVRDGLILIFWGLAKKLIVAERLGVFVGTVFRDYESYGGVLFLITAAVYSVQIYADFSGCMDIAAGSARVFGIEIEKNFLRPYFSESIPEFWRRWHVTLGTWFKDYIFIPVSISKPVMKLGRNIKKKTGGKFGKQVPTVAALTVVWLLTGIWHGAELKYIVWGMFHGTLIILSTLFGGNIAAWTGKAGIHPEKTVWKLFRIARTFFLCCIGRIFFVARGVRAGLAILVSAFAGPHLRYLKPSVIAGLGINKKNWLVLAVFCAVWFAVSVLSERGRDVLSDFSRLPLLLRWCLLYLLVFGVLIFGVYGAGVNVSAFIYEQF